jgi:multiple antibiotic resistance protein
MFDFTYVFTIFFLLLGPAKIIPVFARLTHGAEPAYCRRVAVYATLFATVMCGAISLLARTLVTSYHLGVPTIQLTGGLILLIWALNAIFAVSKTTAKPAADQGATQLALAPLASPVIVTPAGVAALMVFVLLSPGTPQGYQIVSSALALVMVLNFLVMYFNAQIVHRRLVMVPLQLLSAVLAVVQVAFAVQVILNALKAMGVIGEP